MKYFYGVFVLVVIGVGGWYMLQRGSGEQVMCTADALMCPDGSGVGRTGLQCSFSPCPTMPEITGELAQDAAGYRIIIPAPQPNPQEVTYAMPLVVTAVSADVEALLGERVTVTGVFTEGNTLVVASMTPALAGSDIHEATLRVGETKLIGGVLVTLKEVTQDSRCAKDVQCVWAGRATVRAQLRSDTDHAEVSISSDDDPRPFDAWEISIERVLPEPSAGQEISQEEYRVSFRVIPLAQQ